MRILSLDGGGYLGLATAAFLELYHKLGTTVFPPGLILGYRPIRWARQLVWPKFSNRGLRESLTKVFGDTTLGDIAAKGKKVLVPAFCVSAGRPRVFKTDHSPPGTPSESVLSAHNRYRLVDVAMASSAAPVYLPLVNIAKPHTQAIETFCDGGVMANHPALLGLVEAIHTLRVPPADVALLSISTPRINLQRKPASRMGLNRGVLGWGKSLASIFIEGASGLSEQVLRRLTECWPHPRPCYVRIELYDSLRLDMDDTRRRTSQTLESIGRNAAEDKLTREKLARFLA
jgi:patatin-like phospholipase/acyl hydrolase